VDTALALQDAKVLSSACVISDRPASHLPWTSECFSGQQSPGQQRVGATIAWGEVVFKWKQLEVLNFCLHY